MPFVNCQLIAPIKKVRQFPTVSCSVHCISIVSRCCYLKNDPKKAVKSSAIAEYKETSFDCNMVPLINRFLTPTPSLLRTLTIKRYITNVRSPTIAPSTLINPKAQKITENCQLWHYTVTTAGNLNPLLPLTPSLMPDNCIINKVTRIFHKSTANA